MGVNTYEYMGYEEAKSKVSGHLNILSSLKYGISDKVIN